MRGAREAQSDHVSKTNIGLNIKFNKRSEEVAGYSRKTEHGWTYSKACIKVGGMWTMKESFPNDCVKLLMISVLSVKLNNFQVSVLLLILNENSFLKAAGY